MIRYLSAILVLMLCMSNKPGPVQRTLKVVPAKKVFYTYEWSRFELPELGDLGQYHYHFKGAGDLYIQDKYLSVIAAGDAPVKITISSEEEGWESELSLKPQINPNYDSKWEQLGDGKLPSKLPTVQFMPFLLFRRYQAMYKEVPDFELESISGEVYTADDLKGKVTWIHFWQAGQNHTAEELNAQREVAKEYGKNEKVQFLSFFLDEVESEADGNLAFYTGNQSVSWQGQGPRIGDGFKYFANCRTVSESCNTFLHPSHYLVDQEGKVHQITSAGFAKHSDSSVSKIIKKGIEELLDSDRASSPMISRN